MFRLSKNWEYRFGDPGSKAIVLGVCIGAHLHMERCLLLLALDDLQKILNPRLIKTLPFWAVQYLSIVWGVSNNLVPFSIHNTGHSIRGSTHGSRYSWKLLYGHVASNTFLAAAGLHIGA